MSMTQFVLSNARFGRMRTICPSCTNLRTPANKNDLCLSLKDEGDRVVWHCWHCGEAGAVRKDDNVNQSGESMNAVAAKPIEASIIPLRQFNTLPLDETGSAFLAGRSISGEVMAFAGLVSGAKTYRKAGHNIPSVGFVYGHKDQAYAIKWRSVDGKEFTQDGSAQTLYLADKITGSKNLVITEGEIDALSFWTAGIPAVSIPSGAIEAGLEDNASRLRFMLHHDDLLGAVENVFIATDMDAPGETTGNELARRIGKAKCWKVKFPEGCKDANATLMKHGAQGLVDAFTAAQRWPIEGVASPNDFMDKVLGLYRTGLPKGVSTGWSVLDDIFSLNAGNLVVVTGIPGHGKALALDTEIPTPSGWTTMGAISVGDSVYAPDGSVTKVLKVSSVMEGRPCLRVSFKDGASVIADEDHQWMTRDEKARNSHYANKAKRGDRVNILPKGTDQTHKRIFSSIKTTRQIADTLTYRGRRNHSVARAKAVHGEGWDCPIPPYTLGAWLGDGTSASGGFTSNDPEIIARIELDGFEVSKNKAEHHYHIKGLIVALRDIEVLNNKHIPASLLRSSVASRIELLRGLMDTDGYIPASGGMSEFTGVNERLCLGVFELAASLGLRPKLYPGRAMLYGKDCGPKYRIVMANLVNPFCLSRKADKVRVSEHGLAWHNWQQIVDVKPEQSVPVRCIMVDHPSHEFLITRNFIPTHNSTFLDALLMNAMQSNDWRVAYASFENPTDIHISKLLSQRVGMPFGLGPSARMSEAQMMTGLEWVNERVSFLTNDGIMPTVNSLIERFEIAVRRHGVKACVVDPFNFVKLSTKKDGGIDTEAINEMLSAFKMFAQRAEITFFLVAHPAKPMGAGADFVPTGYSISGSAHFFNRADFGLTVHRKDGFSNVHVWKARFGHQGRNGVAKLIYDNKTGGYVEQLTPVIAPPDDWSLDLPGEEDPLPF